MPYIDDAIPAPDPSLTPAQVRKLCRTNTLQTPNTAGYCPGYVQANIIMLPASMADDFRSLCQRNPVPCPLLGETKPGDPRVPEHLAKDADIRTDCARFNVYKDGKFVETKTDVMSEWKDDTVAFFIGCSYSFESALLEAGLGIRHLEIGKMTPCYKTSVPLLSAGVFTGRMVVSMRPYRPEQIPEIIKVTRPFARTHGEPVAWGPEGAKMLGIDDVEGQNPTWGMATVMKEGEIPVYWGCGISPQQAVMDSNLEGVYMSHEPGMMFVTDMKVKDTF